ncbi:unnamed protein product [Rotaria sordida]|uniref:F-box domain-containing protein n=1 Tax=Rotaria sordida TaxID=392033 RepID=A0A815U565_9BILA|nr:unnamed protein product [Rotaria sordida]CAF4103204.1 unnamed protein product [Rotaria sordida]
MKFESLPNEILLDLFDYFNGIDLLHAFNGLNYHFNSLLYKQYQPYHFKFNSISKYNFDTICSQHLPFITDRIISLSLSDNEKTPGQINLFRSYISSFSQFTRLRSLSIYHLHSYDTLMKIIDECHHLNYLTYLNFYSYFSRFQYNQKDFQSIVNNIWNFPQLTHCNVDISIQGYNFFSIPTKISTSLKYLNMYNNKLTWNQINKLFEYTPYIKHLSIIIFSGINDYYIPSSSFPTLIDLKISIYHMSDTSKIISFLQNTPNLHRLNITLWSKFINGHQWEHVICNYLPKLKVFQLRMNDTFYNVNIEEQANELVNSFRSSFWIDEHNWFIRCITSDNTIRLYTLSKLFNYYELKHPDLLQSTYLHDNQQEFYNNITSIMFDYFFNSSIPSNISLPNIQELDIKFPINNQFWSIVPNLKRLHSLKILSYTDEFYSQLQFLLDQAHHLSRLAVHQDLSLPFQLSLFKLINKTVRILNLNNYYCFNEEKCVTLNSSLLGIQCQILYVRIEYLESVIIICKNMINLRVMYVKCTDGKNTVYLPKPKENDQFFNVKQINIDEVIKWLKDRLPSTYLIVEDPNWSYHLQIWIK